MNPNWAEENLQTIRTLMERSALYRRALAPIMFVAGVIGLATSAIGLTLHITSPKSFGFLWLGAATVTIIGTFFIARRQAVSDGEKFWSPPTRQVAHALSLPLGIGFVLGLFPIVFAWGDEPENNYLTAMIWILFYGNALYSAGFFMPRGIKIFGLIFVVADLSLLIVILNDWLQNVYRGDISAHWLMGFFFGFLHLAYGIYLYFTEKKNSAA